MQHLKLPLAMRYILGIYIYKTSLADSKGAEPFAVNRLFLPRVPLSPTAFIPRNRKNPIADTIFPAFIPGA